MKVPHTKFWNVFTPVSLFLLSIGGVVMVFIDGVNHDMKLDAYGYCGLIVAGVSAILFKGIHSVINKSDENEQTT